jgi:hypothetical protein
MILETIYTLIIPVVIILVVWFCIAAIIANGFGSREDMTLPIFIAGLIPMGIIAIFALVFWLLGWFK